MINTLCIFGTRPEAIKMAPVIHQLNNSSMICNKVCITGQHVEMLNSLLELFRIVPDYNLQVMTENQTLTQLTTKILSQLVTILTQFKPQLVLVHGDTTTTLAAALSAYYHRIPIAHVEAGLRTHDLLLPWPEEGNRKLTDALTSLYFAPTETAKNNLLNEGVAPHKIHVTGNTVIDSLMLINKKLDGDLVLQSEMQANFSFLAPTRKMILVTGHRRENFGKGFETICKAIAHIAAQFPTVDIVYPVHLNPKVQEPVNSLLAHIPNVHLIAPLDYLPFVYLMKNAYLILTDSGGIQEEAPSLGKPVLVMRDKTERQEAIKAGGVKLVGNQTKNIVRQVELLLTDENSYQSMCCTQNPYGDGTAAHRILQCIETYFAHASMDDYRVLLSED